MTDATAPLPDLRDEFATVYLPSRNLAANTRATYLRVVDACLAYLARHGITQVEAVGLRELNGYFAQLDRLGRSGTTRRLHTHALKAFFRFLEDHRHVKHSAAVRLIPPKSEDRTPRVLTETEYRRLREAVGNRPRMAAIVELMLQTGIRIGELVKLQLRDIQLPSVSAEERGQLGEFWIRQGKGRKDRRLPLNRRVCGALRTYLAVRPEAETPALFLSKYRNPLSARAVEHLFHKSLAIARIEDASPHTLRHTMATHMITSGRHCARSRTCSATPLSRPPAAMSRSLRNNCTRTSRITRSKSPRPNLSDAAHHKEISISGTTSWLAQPPSRGESTSRKPPSITAHRSLTVIVLTVIMLLIQANKSPYETSRSDGEDPRRL